MLNEQNTRQTQRLVQRLKKDFLIIAAATLTLFLIMRREKLDARKGHSLESVKNSYAL